jgi:probable rRNA maturation factor
LNLQVDIQTACPEPVPEEEDIRSWIAAAIPSSHGDTEVSVRIVDENEMSTLNLNYRGKNAPTNVLSFPSDLPAGIDSDLLGDIVICAAVVEEEARAQDKALTAHWSHMFVHGSLHLLGYDHIEDDEAEVMEKLETEILYELGFPCPYDQESHSRKHSHNHSHDKTKAQTP